MILLKLPPILTKLPSCVTRGFTRSLISLWYLGYKAPQQGISNPPSGP